MTKWQKIVDNCMEFDILSAAVLLFFIWMKQIEYRWTRNLIIFVTT